MTKKEGGSSRHPEAELESILPGFMEEYHKCVDIIAKGEKRFTGVWLGFHHLACGRCIG